MKVSVSLLGVKDLKKDLDRLKFSSVDYFHVDVMDGKFVKNYCDQFRMLNYLADTYAKPLDVHLMVEEPEKYIEKFASLNTEYLVFHLELKKDLINLLKLAKSYSIKTGLAINPETPLSILEPYLDYLDIVLLMTVVPGYGGQKFMAEVVPKIEELNKIRKEENLEFVISVDGGINQETRKLINLDEKDILVSGSYLLSGDLEENIRSLR